MKSCEKINETKGTYQGNTANTDTEGSSKNRKRAEGYIEDKKYRRDCRYKHVHGIIRAIGDLKACTGDDVFVEFYRTMAEWHKSGKTVTRYSTFSDILRELNFLTPQQQAPPNNNQNNYELIADQ